VVENVGVGGGAGCRGGGVAVEPGRSGSGGGGSSRFGSAGVLVGSGGWGRQWGGDVCVRWGVGVVGPAEGGRGRC